MHARSYVFYRKGCFPTQPHRDSHFVRVILSPEHQLTLAPAQAQQFLSNNSSAFGFGSFAAQFPGMVLAQFTFHPRQLLLAERLAPHIPATPERLEPFLIYGFLPTGVHPFLKTLSAGGSIFRDSMFTQKPVRSHPLRPMFRG